MIRYEAHVLAAKRRELLRFENIEAGLHACRVTSVFRCRTRRNASGRKQRDKDHELDEREACAFESSQRVPRYCNHTMIFWNALAEAALRARCACAMYKCRLPAAAGGF